MKITTPADLESIEISATRSAEHALRQLASCSGPNALQILWRLKVEAIGCDPMNTSRPLNLIEQLNQTFTYIASARATRILLENHPEAAPFTLNLGTAAGSDIASDNEGGIAAEVFAAVNTSSNRKLAKDIAKVSGSTARFKYVFYMCPGIAKGFQGMRGQVSVWSVGSDL